jgi:hypothetical protein
VYSETSRLSTQSVRGYHPALRTSAVQISTYKYGYGRVHAKSSMHVDATMQSFDDMDEPRRRLLAIARTLLKFVSLSVAFRCRLAPWGIDVQAHLGFVEATPTSSNLSIVCVFRK